MIDITRHQELIVRQQVEALEAITGFETRNRYEVLTPDGQQVMYAYEESGGLSRFFLKTHRPLDLHVVDTNGNPILTASRQFFWFFSHLHMSDDSGRHVGALNRQLGFLKRRFTLTDQNEQPIGEVVGSLFRPYTFFVRDLRGGGDRPRNQAVVRSLERRLHRRRHFPGPVQRLREVSGLPASAAHRRVRDRPGLLRKVEERKLGRADHAHEELVTRARASLISPATSESSSSSSAVRSTPRAVSPPI